MAAKVDVDEGKQMVDWVWSELEREGLSLPGSDSTQWRHDTVKAVLLKQVRKLVRRGRARKPKR